MIIKYYVSFLFLFLIATDIHDGRIPVLGPFLSAPFWCPAQQNCPASTRRAGHDNTLHYPYNMCPAPSALQRLLFDHARFNL